MNEPWGPIQGSEVDQSAALVTEAGEFMDEFWLFEDMKWMPRSGGVGVCCEMKTRVRRRA